MSDDIPDTQPETPGLPRRGWTIEGGGPVMEDGGLIISGDLVIENRPPDDD